MVKEYTKELADACARHKKLVVIFTSVLLALCVVGMVVATFVDLRLSQALNDPNQGYSKFLHDYGEWTAYFINVGFGIGLSVWLIKCKRYFWAIIPFLFAIVFGSFFSLMWLENTSMPVLFNTLFNMVCVGVFFCFFFFAKDEFHKKALYILGVTFIITNFVYIIMLALKYLWGRVRFWDLADNFTAWYRPNGINGHQSFPSGHVLSAASTLMLWLVPIIFKIKNPFARATLIILPILYTLSMMYARIVVGAHYLSDVVFSILLLTVCTVIFLWIIFRRVNKKGR